jgi:hypothetical protein
MNNNLEFENEDPTPDSIENNHPRTNYGEGYNLIILNNMKPIKLTEEHKSKLLEMCKVLFPKSKFKIIGCLLISFEYNKVEGDEEIHWFEFCMTHLTTKLYNISHLKNESSIKQLRGYICQEVDHPIDYLYQEFKKLK